MPPKNYQGPGVYQHYKGGWYRVIGLSVQEDTLEDGNTDNAIVFVIYEPISEGSLLPLDLGYGEIKFWSREISDFNGQIERNGVYMPRFKLVKADA